MNKLRDRLYGGSRGWIARTFITLLAVGTVVVSVFALTGSTASAQNQDIAAIQLEPLRSTRGAATVPYRVTAVADRAIEGTLQIRVVNQNVTFEFPLALAANTEISQLLAIPVESDFIGEINANLVVDGTSVGSDELFGDNGNRGTEFVAGVLGLEVTAEQAQVTPPVGMVTNVEIDDLRILSALDIVVSSPAALRTLTIDEQSQLFTWVGSGGQLVVADDADSIGDLLPALWQSSESTIVAGVGEINFVGTDWDEAIPPPLSTRNNGNFIGDFTASDTALASDAGFEIPSIGLLSVVLLGYLFIIGPVTFAVLAKLNRQSLAWLAVPALAVLFGVVIVGAGRVLISGRNDAYATIVTVTPAGSEITSTLLIADDGNQRVELPPGWSARGSGTGTDNFRFDDGGGGPELVVSPSRTTTELSLDIDTGSAAVLRVDGRTADAELPFSFADLQIVDGNLTGSVTNDSGVDLFEAAVFVGSNAMYFDEFGSGETIAFEVQMQPADRLTFPETDEWDVRIDFRFGNFDDQLDDAAGVVNGATWMGWRLDNFGAAVPDGMVTAVGWSRDLDQYSLIGGEGRTALVQHAPLPTGDAVTSGQIRRTIPRAAHFDDVEGFGRNFGEGVPSQFIRPAGATTDNLAIETSSELEELAMWVDGEWRYLDLASNPDARTVSIPEEAWMNDRLTTIFGFVGFAFDGNGASFQPRIVDRENDTAAGVLVPSGERSTRDVDFEDDFGFENDFGPEFVNEEQTLVRDVGDNLAFEAEGLLDNSFDTWSVLLEPGEVVTVTMRSDDLDSLLIVTLEDGSVIAENDDAAGGNLGLDSQVEFVAEDWGIHIIETRPLVGPAFGEYRVIVDIEATDVASFPRSAEGELNIGEVDDWPVRLTAGETVTLTVTSDFVPELAWIDVQGVSTAIELAEDGTSDFTPDSDGVYTVSVSGEDPEGSGNYQFELLVEGAS